MLLVWRRTCWKAVKGERLLHSAWSCCQQRCPAARNTLAGKNPMPRVRGSRGLVPIIPVVIRHVQGTRAFSVNAVCYRDKDAVRGGGGGTERVELQGQTSTTIQEDERQSFEKENIWTIPNVLSLMRVLLSPVLGYQVLHGNYLMAFGLLSVAAVSDVVDGHIARHYPSQSSMLGSVLDPLADKCLISVLCITLTLQGLIPLPLTVIILSRDAFLVGASFYLRYLTLPPPRTWSRYWDIQRSTLQVTPSALGKINTLLQLSTVGLSLGAPLVDATYHPALQALWIATAVSTVTSGASYIIRMKGFRILREKRLE